MERLFSSHVGEKQSRPDAACCSRSFACACFPANGASFVVTNAADGSLAVLSAVLFILVSVLCAGILSGIGILAILCIGALLLPIIERREKTNIAFTR